jgi:hypothetical protein
VAKSKTSFKKGQTGNAAGRPAIAPELKGIRELNRIELERILNRCAFLTLPEIKALASKKNRTASVFEMSIAKVLQLAFERGDHWRLEFVLQRLIGRVREEKPLELPPPRDVSPAKRTFSEFCAAAGYPLPYPKQIEMFDFASTPTEPRLILGARGYGKTDYVTILGDAYEIYMDETLEHSILIITDSKTRNSAIVAEIAKALTANGVELEKENTSVVRVKGKVGKDHSIEAITIRSSFRGRHPKKIKLDDPVTETSISPAHRELVQRKYNEAFKLCSDITVIGQPVHAQDLYAKLRPLLKVLELPWGTIPELDHDLEAQRLAGVDEKSISASYHLKIISDGSMPFEKINYIDKYPVGDSVAFLDPSHKGKDCSALSIVRQHFQGVAVVGFAAHRAWNHWADEIAAYCKRFGVKKLCIECNGLGDQPVLLMRQKLQGTGIGVVGMDSTDNKHARIMSAGAFAHLIHLSKESDRAYTDQVIQYEYGSEPDDSPDSLATCLKWIGLIRGKS